MYVPTAMLARCHVVRALVRVWTRLFTCTTLARPMNSGVRTPMAGAIAQNRASFLRDKSTDLLVICISQEKTCIFSWVILSWYVLVIIISRIPLSDFWIIIELIHNIAHIICNFVQVVNKILRQKNLCQCLLCVFCNHNRFYHIIK